MLRLMLCFATLSLVSAPLVSAQAPDTGGEKRAGWNFKAAAAIPVQSGGRVKPFDTYTRELMLFTTGSRFFQGWDPVEMVLSWMTFPAAWDAREFILITRKDVKTQLGLPEDKKYFSPRELLQNSALLQYANQVPKKTMAEPPMKTMEDLREDPRQKELKVLMERVATFRAIVSGEGWPVVPGPKGEPWKSLVQIDPTQSSTPEQIKNLELVRGFRDLVLAYRDGKKAEFEASAESTRLKSESLMPEFNAGVDRTLRAEVFFNRTHPFLYAWIFALLAGLLWLWENRVLRRLAAVATAVTFGLSSLGLALRCYIAGRPPVTNMYESVIFVAWGVILFAFILWLLQKRKTVLPFTVGCFVSALAFVAADSAPAVLDPAIHPLVPVLRSNYWLLIHVLTITISYAAFALAFGIANVALFNWLKGKPSTDKIPALNLMAYRVMQFGVVLLAAGTILGGIWADYSWGRFWGWDPKEVWALIALMSYLALLHARFAGWAGPFAFSVWTVLCFTTVVMAWYGVNFVLGVGLHSYGFSTGGRGTVAAFVVVQLAFVAVVWVAHKKRQLTAKPS